MAPLRKLFDTLRTSAAQAIAPKYFAVVHNTAVCDLGAHYCTTAVENETNNGYCPTQNIDIRKGVLAAIAPVLEERFTVTNFTPIDLSEQAQRVAGIVGSYLQIQHPDRNDLYSRAASLRNLIAPMQHPLDPSNPGEYRKAFCLSHW